MSTTKRAKAARQAAHALAKKKREYEKMFATSKPKKKEFVEYKHKETFTRETQEYPSFKSTSCTAHATAKAESKRYTGTLVKGIATMHKSNAVPVISQQEAEDISKMRRG
jgi:hypothetical protein